MRFDDSLDFVPMAMFFSKKDAKAYVEKNVKPFGYSYKIVKVKSYPNKGF